MIKPIRKKMKTEKTHFFALQGVESGDFEIQNVGTLFFLVQRVYLKIHDSGHLTYLSKGYPLKVNHAKWPT